MGETREAPMMIPVPSKSTLVTVLAYLGIAFGGFAVVVAALQHRMVTMAPYGEAMDRALQDSTFVGVAPPAWRFLFANFRTLTLIGLAAGATTVVSAVGLLRRRNWARIAFIGLLLLGIASAVALLLLQDAMMPDVTAAIARDSTLQQAANDFASVARAMRLFMLGVSVGVVSLFGWLIARLLSPGIRAEFAQPE
jgi:hypothetical protein